MNFRNDTTQTLRIKIPIGLRLAPEDTSVQTMITAGGEIITVPPGDSSAVLKAFCGEMNDSAPGTSDVFYPDGFVDSKLMNTLKRINSRKSYDSNGQDAVWSVTDGRDISYNETAQDLAGGGTIPVGKTAAAAGAGILTLFQSCENCFDKHKQHFTPRTQDIPDLL